MEFIIIKLKLRQEKLAMDLFTYRDKISQPLTACKRNPGVCAYTQTVMGKFDKNMVLLNFVSGVQNPLKKRGVF
jgi:hypothetical protein